jgi:hypothetical protein
VVDYGYTADGRKEEILDYCLWSGLRFHPVKGSSNAQGMHSLTNANGRIDYKGVSIPLLTVNDPEWKSILFITMIQQRLKRLHLPQSAKYDKVLREHLTGERLVERITGGKKHLEWISKRENHIADCIKYCLAYKSLFEHLLEAPVEAPQAPPQPQQAPAVPIQQPYQPIAYGWD